ncbi:LacI family DNA-binding transcriptional regulator [Steroidobacter sp. S1-65]|uniref:LacI family DNA-binding transcriptional regulator n=1 Tax=Steroidobacter gossypii TaxID=2805490 RepID=A0ABS1WR36_9GAMM|nr:LacI family DNA-binding transcriptional regulator [Steroidobacter gossypii]MBM0103430.1 LacI family DNA-binding transcriptional regulator [Steroidobacter gossypii]
MSSSRATSIRQVARQAGVSIATVSRALTTPDKVSDKTLKKVLAQVERSRYKPNLLARNFRSKRAFSVVVLVPNIANPFFAEIIRGIEQVAQQHGYAVLLGDTEGREDREAYYVGLVETRQADGLIQLHPRLPKAARGANGGLEIPLVNACEYIEDAPCPRVGIDNAAAAREMTKYLLDLGHRRIGVVLGPDSSPLTSDRLRGYKLALRAAKIAADDALIAQGDFTMSSGSAAAERLFKAKQPPTAVFCFNDEMALGAIRFLKSTGRSVPQDVSVVGFDDIEFASFCDPPLTTIEQPTREIGNKAMSLLFEMLNGGKLEPAMHTLPIKLIVRDSAAPPPRR